MNEIEKSRVSRIVELHTEIGGYLKMTIDKAIEIGELLSEQKLELKHGGWSKWIAGNLPFTLRTAQNYMSSYKNQVDLKNENISLLTDAYQRTAQNRIKTGEIEKKQARSLYGFPIVSEKTRAEVVLSDEREYRVFHAPENKWEIAALPNKSGVELHGAVEAVEKSTEFNEIKKSVDAEKERLLDEARELRKQAEQKEKEAREISHILDDKKASMVRGFLDKPIYYYLETAQFKVAQFLDEMLLKSDSTQEVIEMLIQGYEFGDAECTKAGTWGDCTLSRYSDNGIGFHFWKGAVTGWHQAGLDHGLPL